MLTPVRIDGHEIQPRDEIHRRKLEALRVFVERLLASPARDQIAKIILFGSVARGEAHAESDVDVMVYGFQDLDALRDATFDASLEMGEYSGEGIESLFETIEEWLAPQDYFNYTVRRFGQEVYSVPEENLKAEEAQGLLKLARLNLAMAEKHMNPDEWRGAADLSYNAAELCVKAFLLFQMELIPSSHGGLVEKFGEHYIKSGLLPRELGKQLHRALEIRSQARYKFRAVITEEMAQHNLTLAQALISRLETTLSQ
ncbi:MAG: HEPN domain-containing protein [Chloroflexi bacterium]|nr:HEPN domain-containing protein [Chloroflexota bacterium]